VPNRPKRDEIAHRGAEGALSRMVRVARRDSALSQQEVAVAAGVSIGTVRGLESGRSVDPSFFTVLGIARALGIASDELLALLDVAEGASDSEAL
jgi:transcriptional regulator with XRE-family HTH domain